MLQISLDSENGAIPSAAYHLLYEICNGKWEGVSSTARQILHVQLVCQKTVQINERSTFWSDLQATVSPDMNCIDNMWAVLTSDHKTTMSFFQIISEEGDTIPKHVIRAHTSSMRCTVDQICSVQGGPQSMKYAVYLCDCC